MAQARYADSLAACLRQLGEYLKLYFFIFLPIFAGHLQI